MKLKLEHLAPYLPYNLGITWKNIDDNNVIEYMDLKGTNKAKINILDVLELGYKPILRPLTDLRYNCSASESYIKNEVEVYDYDCTCMRYSDVIELIKEHYDVFGLIEKGLAIDKNTL